jgi:hypothetical protein
MFIATLLKRPGAVSVIRSASEAESIAEMHSPERAAPPLAPSLLV